MSPGHSDSSWQQRREQWFTRTRAVIQELVAPDGTGRTVVFNPPYREPVWILPALFTGDAEHVALANRMVAHYHDTHRIGPDGKPVPSGQAFNIFQSTCFAHCLHRFDALLTDDARAVMTWHAQQVFRTYKGAAQPDFKFHGANDNMPMMATQALILGGEALRDENAIKHGVWNLHQFRRLLSRSAWASEFNSSTYSAITLSGAAKIATFAHDENVWALARDIEHRLWAELLLHYHPGTMNQAGPQCRAYSIDLAGHNHSVQALFWCAFGAERTGRDLIASYFSPDPREVLHFAGNPWQSIAEFCDMLDADLHVPADLVHLIEQRKYPSVHRGRSECMGRFDGQSGVYHTHSYMVRAFSLGTVNGPLSGGEQTTPFLATYQRVPDVRSFRDAGTIFPRYLTSDERMGTLETSPDGQFRGERYVSNRSWCYALQHDNTALLLCTPNLRNNPLETDTLKLCVVFPAHFGQVTASVIGDGPVHAGFTGRSVEVVPVSLEAGQVFVHVQPLLPTNLQRKVAISLVRHGPYEVLELHNYHGLTRKFTRRELARVLNGLVLTIVDKQAHNDLLTFHRAMSDVQITDYLFSDHRFVHVIRRDVDIEVVYTPEPFGVQTEAINGRAVERPVFESNQIDVSKLPFMTGPVPLNSPLFPWGNSLEANPYESSSWLIGSRGLPGERSYSQRIEAIKSEGTTT